MNDDLQKKAMLVITERWLSEWKSEAGGYRRAQLAVLGVSWPPRPGWRDAVVGRAIPAANALQFQAASGKIPARVEARLADLVSMGEFNLTEVEECRRGYWTARDEWHTILINCYDRAQKRQAAAPPA